MSGWSRSVPRPNNSFNSGVRALMEESRPYRFKISLRLRHPRSELSVCSSEFGLEPFRQWTVGQERISPRGTQLGGVWGESYWTAPLEIFPGEDVEDALARVSQWLDGHAPFLARHLASGGSTSLFSDLSLREWFEWRFLASVGHG